MKKYLMTVCTVILIAFMSCQTVHARWTGITDGGRRTTLESDGSVPVTMQDQTTPPVILPLSRLVDETTLSAAAVRDEYTFTVADPTGFVDGLLIFLSTPATGEVMFCEQVGAPADSVITIDRPLDYAFVSGTYVSCNDTDMAVNGATTPVIFSLRPGNIESAITVDVTRIMIAMTTTAAVDLSKFGDIAAGLTYGITLRRVDGRTNNIFNVKTNGGLAAIAYDISFYDAQNATQGQHGLTARLTFAGMNKLGVAIRIGPDDDLQLIVHDNLSSLLKFSVIAEGHIAIVNN